MYEETKSANLAAGQQNAISPRYRNGVQASNMTEAAVPTRENAAIKMVSMLTEENAKLKSAILRLINFNDRMIGPEPKDGNIEKSKDPHCTIDQISDQVDAHVALMEVFFLELNRLERIG